MQARASREKTWWEKRRDEAENGPRCEAERKGNGPQGETGMGPWEGQRAPPLCLAKIRDAPISVLAHGPFKATFENTRSLLWAPPSENLHSLPHTPPTGAGPGSRRPSLRKQIPNSFTSTNFTEMCVHSAGTLQVGGPLDSQPADLQPRNLTQGAGRGSPGNRGHTVTGAEQRKADSSWECVTALTPVIQVTQPREGHLITTVPASTAHYFF